MSLTNQDITKINYKAGELLKKLTHRCMQQGVEKVLDLFVDPSLKAADKKDKISERLNMLDITSISLDVPVRSEIMDLRHSINLLLLKVEKTEVKENRSLFGKRFKAPILFATGLGALAVLALDPPNYDVPVQKPEPKTEPAPHSRKISPKTHGEHAKRNLNDDIAR